MTQQVCGTVTHGYIFLKGGVSKGLNVTHCVGQELEEAQQEVEEKMTKKLQMPPVMDERDAASKVSNIRSWKHKEQV